MRKHKYAWDLGIQIFTIILVVLIFRVIEERKIAALVAGLLFLGVPLSLGVRELGEQRLTKRINKIWWFGSLQFFLLFALPIFLGRIFWWGSEFEKIAVFGIFLKDLHHWANRSYTLMMATTLLSLIFSLRDARRKI